MATVRSRWLQQQPGTPYHLPSGVLLHWLSFAENFKTVLFMSSLPLSQHARPHQRILAVVWANLCLHDLTLKGGLAAYIL